MNKDKSTSFLTCGEVFNPNQLPRKTPVILAKVEVQPKELDQPCVLLNYSKNFAFQTLGDDPIISITYQLIRTLNGRSSTILNEWLFSVEEIIPTQLPDLETIEPLVLNFCDCLSGKQQNKTITYTYQISDFTTSNTAFEILSQEISAIVVNGEDEGH